MATVYQRHGRTDHGRTTYCCNHALSSGAVLHWGRGHVLPPQFHLLPPDSIGSWPFWRDFWGPKMRQNPNFPGFRPGRTPLGELTALPCKPPSWWGGDLFPPFQEPHPLSALQGLTHYRVGNPILMIDFKCRPIWSSYFFGFGERRQWTRWRRGWLGALPQNFGARTAPGYR